MTKTRASMSWRKKDDIASRPWTGAKREYDLFKELTVGVIVVGVLVVGLSAIFSSPDEPTVTLQSWATNAPADFVATATAELGGTSDTAGYGPPYNSTPDATQTVGAIDLQSLSGVKIPIDTAKDFVTGPLALQSNPPSALSEWSSATPDQQAAWTSAYSDALAAAPDGDPTQVVAGDFGPVPDLTNALLVMAQQGALDGAIQNEGGFFNLDYTRSILFLGDGTYFVGLADAAHLTGDQWGMMNETGNYPGQSWLWLFSFWYQVPAIGEAANADILVVGIMLLLTLLLGLVPFIPGLRTLPRWIPLQRLVWKDYYRRR
ncbi:hypothetical protein [Subtercola sp. PAMC28395]|uniref:hypothetical protein n=1 Tax=Subtercola sp. PAMC28395 TaxID=2846775 RepID=UPI00209B3F8C|nr:hypothetical protein [Subtercola sp. PAMC28395]